MFIISNLKKNIKDLYIKYKYNTIFLFIKKFHIITGRKIN